MTNLVQSETLELYVTAGLRLGGDEWHPLVDIDWADLDELEAEREYWGESDMFDSDMDDAASDGLDDDLSEELGTDLRDELNDALSAHGAGDMDVD